VHTLHSITSLDGDLVGTSGCSNRTGASYAPPGASNGHFNAQSAPRLDPSVLLLDCPLSTERVMYPISTQFVPIFCSVSSSTYCLPIIATVTTKMIDDVPMTMPRAVRTKRSFEARKLSPASLKISLTALLFMQAILSSPGLFPGLGRMVGYWLRRSAPRDQTRGRHPGFFASKWGQFAAKHLILLRDDSTGSSTR
jgi:hypothetical protein